MTQSSSTTSIEVRLEKIESALAHLQHDIDSLNSSLMNHFRRMQEFESRFGRVEGELQLISAPHDRSEAASERPPHY